ncbi:unnamed protein product, partial [Vitis vinifera]|uniref:Uncharacterized protein n=1 Tax=Vitis vinifera TaxID=29760 RepID=D7TDL9_VITVI
MKSFQICKFNPLCFSTLHRSGSRMLCLSMRTLLPRVTPRIKKSFTLVPCISLSVKSFAIAMDPK